jgi:hypothetical protein
MACQHPCSPRKKIYGEEIVCAVKDRGKMRNTKCPALIKLHKETVIDNVNHFGINAVVTFIMI